jgi:hypothetical protein
MIYTHGAQFLIVMSFISFWKRTIEEKKGRKNERKRDMKNNVNAK